MKLLIIIASFISTLYSNSVIVEGYAPIITSKQTAEKQALLDAKLRAIEMEIGVFVKSTTQVEDYEIKYDYIEERIEGYVSNYSVLEKDIVDDTFQIKIKAKVKRGKIYKDMDNLISLLNYKKKPKFIIISDGDQLITSSFESSLKRTLLKYKIDMVDKNTLKNSYHNVSSGLNKNIPYKRYGIDYIIVLKIVKQELDINYKGMIHKAVNLIATADVIDASTFEIIVSSKYPDNINDNVSIPQSQLIQESQIIANKFSKNLLISVADQWKDNMYNGENILVNVKGLKSYKLQEELKDYFKENITDIKTIYTKDYNKGEAIYVISIKGGIDKFLDEFIMCNDKYSIEIENKDTNKCTLKIN
ncbi:MAG: hypothetical protein U9N59_06820 [Campylobacterota bacterium]|nr:hypothetical protein [Campylobacterota bacterium]